MPWDHTTELRGRIARFEEAIAAFRRSRDEMLARRVGAAESIAHDLDERLVVNARTLEALQRSRDLTKEDLERAEGEHGPRPHFVVIDDTPGGRSFFTNTLRRGFPQAEIIECENSEDAVEQLRSRNPAVFLLHRANDADGLPLVEQLRAVSASVPIVYVSSLDRNDAALVAGATTFLLFDQSEMIVPVVRDILRPD